MITAPLCASTRPTHTHIQLDHICAHRTHTQTNTHNGSVFWPCGFPKVISHRHTKQTLYTIPTHADILARFCLSPTRTHESGFRTAPSAHGRSLPDLNSIPKQQQRTGSASGSKFNWEFTSNTHTAQQYAQNTTQHTPEIRFSLMHLLLTVGALAPTCHL